MLEQSWAATLEHVSALPPGTVDVSVDGEWSFAQTLRHLVFAIDKWLPRGALQSGQDAHPLGLNHAAVDVGPPPPYEEVLVASADRRAQVRAFLAAATPALLDEEHPSPNDPTMTETARQCVQVILKEGWEHLRFATRDLDALEAGRV